MVKRPSRIYVAVTLLVAGVVAGATIAQAIREHSWDPVWSIGWLPAVLVATLGTRRDTRGCVWRLGRRGRSSSAS
jgi:hypothetical protein